MKELSFEEALKKLSEINNKLESETISLDESIDLFKKGLELTKYCQNKLEKAKFEIEELEKN